MRKLILSIFLLCTSFLQTEAQSILELRSLYDQGEYDAVLQKLPAPTTPAELLLWADAHHKLSHFDDAMRGYTQSELLGEQSTDLFLNRAICAFSMGDFELARRDLLTVKEQKEDKRIPYYFGAMAYLDNNFKGATEFLKDALKLDQNYMDAHYLLGAIYLEQKKFLSAETAFIKCLNLRPEFSQSKVNLALCYIEQFKFQEAIDELNQLIESNTTDALTDAYYQLGVCYFQMHDTDTACENWTRAADRGDEDAKAHLAGICEGNQRRIKRRKNVHMAF